MADHRDHPADETRTTADPVHGDEAVYTEDRRDVVGREREEHGGVKVGSAFFGWLTATGMAVLLDRARRCRRRGRRRRHRQRAPRQAPTPSSATDAETVGLVGGIVLLVDPVRLLLLRRLRGRPDGALRRRQAGRRRVGVGASWPPSSWPSLGARRAATSTTSSRTSTASRGSRSARAT